MNMTSTTRSGNSPAIVRQRTAEPTRQRAESSYSAASGRTVAVTPANLPQPTPPDIAVIDVDNLVIGRGGRIDPIRAMAELTEVYRQLNSVRMTLAVMSTGTHRALGDEPWFRFGGWTWRVADVGADAADHQLLEFARTAAVQRPGARIAIASGDGIFEQLSRVAQIEVVVPQGHHGMSRALRPHLRVRRGRATSAGYGLAA